jgi:hypothetical protein
MTIWTYSAEAVLVGFLLQCAGNRETFIILNWADSLSVSVVLQIVSLREVR